MSPSELVMLPWSIVGPRLVQDQQGNRHYEMRVKELPDFFVAGRTESEVLYDFKRAFLAFLESFAGHPLPVLPQGMPVKYALFTARPSVERPVQLSPDQPTTGSTPAFASLQIE